MFAFVGILTGTLMAAFLVGERDAPRLVRDPVRGGIVRLVVESDNSGRRKRTDEREP